MANAKPVSVEELREEFRARGWSVAAWARQRGIDPVVAYALLNGRTKGFRGKSYEAAVAMGLVRDPDESGRFSRSFADLPGQQAGSPERGGPDG